MDIYWPDGKEEVAWKGYVEERTRPREKSPFTFAGHHSDVSQAFLRKEGGELWRKMELKSCVQGSPFTEVKD